MPDKIKKRSKMARECPVAAHWPPEVETDSVMVRGTEEKMLSYDLISCKGGALTWMDKSTGASRVPVETTRKFVRGLPFMAAGRSYLSMSQLAERRKEPGSCWHLDCYGRKVLEIAERFPCFDSFDALHESRYYRWFFLRENGALTRVYATDARSTIYVTEDAAFLENAAWKLLEEHGCLDRW